jgi:hypothetical protein
MDSKQLLVLIEPKVWIRVISLIIDLAGSQKCSKKGVFTW